MTRDQPPVFVLLPRDGRGTEHAMKGDTDAMEEMSLALIADSLPVLVGYVDARQRFRFHNRAYSDWLGMSPSMIQGRTMREVLGERVYGVLQGNVEKALSGERVEFEADVPYPTGTRHVRGLYVPHRLPSGEVDGFAILVSDLTPQHAAIQSLREQVDIVETLNASARRLAGELDTQRLLQGITDDATRLSGAQFGAFFYNVRDERGGSYMLYTISGVPREAFSSFPMPRATALFGPTFEGKEVIRLDDVRRDPRYGRNPPYHGMPAGHLPVVSYLAVPVKSRSGEIIGGLFFGHAETARFGPQEERLVTGLAAHAAVALDTARTFETLAAARTAAEAAERRYRFLADAGEILASSLDYEVTLDAVLRLTVPQLADWIGVDLREADGSLQRIALALADPDKEALAWDLTRRYPPDPEADGGVPQVVRTGQPLLYAEITDELLAASARDDEHLRLLRDLKLRSAMIVPLNARGRTLGALWLATTDSGRRYGPDDLDFAQRIADRAAMAIDNARLYRSARARRTGAGPDGS
jgi:PAS domain S-box-containing protein